MSASLLYHAFGFRGYRYSSTKYGKGRKDRQGWRCALGVLEASAPLARKVRAVATDMSAAYIDAVRAGLPEATLVFDRFHIMKLFNDKLSALRRKLYHQVQAEPRDVLKGVRWLLLSAPSRRGILMANRLNMVKVQAILALHAQGFSQRRIAEELDVHRETVGRVLHDSKPAKAPSPHLYDMISWQTTLVMPCRIKRHYAL